MLLQGWPFGAESERAGSPRRRLVSHRVDRRVDRAVRGLGGWVVAVALLLGPTAGPLAAWAGLPLAAAGCACPPAHCRCPHAGTGHQPSRPAPSATAAASKADADHCASRPSCPLRAAERPGTRSGGGAAVAPATVAASTHAAAHAASPEPAAGTARCSIAARCGGEAPSATGSAVWQPAADMLIGGAAPTDPGDRSPPAAAARLLDTSRSPERPPPRQIAPIA